MTREWCQTFLEGLLGAGHHATGSCDCRKPGMARPLRFVPTNALVEVTTRTLQGRLLLKPSPELTDIILGVVGKAQDLYKMTIHAFVVVGTHAHFLLSPASAEKLALGEDSGTAIASDILGRLTPT